MVKLIIFVVIALAGGVAFANPTSEIDKVEKVTNALNRYVDRYMQPELKLTIEDLKAAAEQSLMWDQKVALRAEFLNPLLTCASDLSAFFLQLGVRNILYEEALIRKLKLVYELFKPYCENGYVGKFVLKNSKFEILKDAMLERKEEVPELTDDLFAAVEKEFDVYLQQFNRLRLEQINLADLFTIFSYYTRQDNLYIANKIIPSWRTADKEVLRKEFKNQLAEWGITYADHKLNQRDYTELWDQIKAERYSKDNILEQVRFRLETFANRVLPITLIGLGDLRAIIEKASKWDPVTRVREEVKNPIDVCIVDLAQFVVGLEAHHIIKQREIDGKMGELYAQFRPYCAKGTESRQPPKRHRGVFTDLKRELLKGVGDSSVLRNLLNEAKQFYIRDLKTLNEAMIGSDAERDSYWAKFVYYSKPENLIIIKKVFPVLERAEDVQSVRELYANELGSLGYTIKNGKLNWGLQGLQRQLEAESSVNQPKGRCFGFSCFSRPSVSD